MPQLPPVPAWDGLHPLIIHFPIALLLVAPVFLLIGAIGGPRGRSYLWSALILMVLGTAAVFVSIETGEAAGKMAERSPEINTVLQRHEHLAERTRVTFTVLTGIFAALMIATHVVQRWRTRLFLTAAPLLLLVAYSFAALLLSDTAHNGGRLVHELGVKALVDTPVNPTPPNQGGQD